MKTLLLLLITSIACAQPPLLLEDDFSANNRFWPLNEKQSIVDGQLLFNAPEDGDQSFISVFIDSQKDFVMTADLVQRSGLADGAVGLVWGANDHRGRVWRYTSCSAKRHRRE